MRGVDAAVWGFVGVVIGGLITGLVSIRLEGIRADKAAALDSAKRQDDRRLGRDNFQRETLLDLQDAANALQRALFLIHMHDVRTSKATGTWGGTPVGEEIAEAENQAHLKIATMRSRIADDEIRALCETLIKAAGTIISTTDEAEADHALHASMQTTTRIQELTGERIRGTFRAD